VRLRKDAYGCGQMAHPELAEHLKLSISHLYQHTHTNVRSPNIYAIGYRFAGALIVMNRRLDEELKTPALITVMAIAAEKHSYRHPFHVVWRKK
jgi:hypothetical protein